MNKMSLKLLKKLGFYGLLVVILFFSLAPFYWQIVSSISLDRDLLQRPPQWVPREPVFYRYGALLGVQEEVTGTRLDIALSNAAQNFRYSAATMPGVESGRITRNKALRGEQPSINAASSISQGTVRKNAAIIQITRGNINDVYVKIKAALVSIN